MPKLIPPPPGVQSSDMDRFAINVYQDVTSGPGTTYARQRRLSEILNGLARDNYEAGVADGRKEMSAPVPCTRCGSLPEDLHRCPACGAPGPGVEFITDPEKWRASGQSPASGSAPALAQPGEGIQGGVG